jgi:hypothetical protein
MIQPNVKASDNKWDNWLDLAREHKRMWVEITERGDMPPTIFGERNGRVLCAVVAPQVDKYQGLQAAAMLRRGLAIDTLTMILDAHIRTGKIGQEDEFMKNYKHGDMQKACDEEGACELGLISDCLVCHRIGQDNKMKMASLTYSYHGKNGGVPFAWNNFGGRDEDGLKVMDENDEGVVLEGNIPHALRQIIKLEPLTDSVLLKAMAQASGGMDLEKQLYHCARAVYTVLSVKGFVVMDYLGHTNPYEQFKQELQQT